MNDRIAGKTSDLDPETLAAIATVEPGAESEEAEHRVWFSSLPAHVQRMYGEQQELLERTNKLTTFIAENPAFAELDPVDQALMTTQSSIMLAYVQVLSARLARVS